MLTVVLAGHVLASVTWSVVVQSFRPFDERTAGVVPDVTSARTSGLEAVWNWEERLRK
jgi:hypothetical protein